VLKSERAGGEHSFATRETGGENSLSNPHKSVPCKYVYKTVNLLVREEGEEKRNTLNYTEPSKNY
jgi:hypothetical protein